MNVNGIRNTNHRKTLFRKFREQSYDVICLQETYITEEVVSMWKKEWGGEFVYSIGTNRSKGQMILFKKNIDIEFETIFSNDRIILVKVVYNDSSLHICNVYAPNNDTNIGEFLNDLSSILLDLDSEKLIVCGDFNSVINNETDIISGEKHPKIRSDNFKNFRDTNNLFDIWRLHNIEEKEFTWSRVINGSLVARRLDYILVTENIVNNTLESSILSFPNSDHRGVAIRLQNVLAERGPGYWKINNSLLSELEYLQLINTVIENFELEYQNKHVDGDIQWELLKIRIKEATLNYSRARAVRVRNKRLRLQEKLNRTDTLLANNSDDNDLIKDRERTKINLELLEDEKTRSIQIRSKEKWILEGEKNTKFFLNLEKSRSNAKIMPKLTLENNDILTDQFEILQAQKQYFENLYTKDNNLLDTEENLDVFLENTDIPKLNEDEVKSCEGKVTVEELGKGLKLLSNGSSPGMDGLSTEFYKVFWNKIGKFLECSFNSSFEKGELSYSQNLAVITLIHKGKELPRDKLTHWRPISLTNSDYKILAKTLAIRLLDVIESIVGKEQSAYIRNRDISDNLSLINDIVDYLREKNKPGVILAIDFSKAFDSISRTFLLNAFKRFGFGAEFVKWISVLMQENKSSLIYNGWISDSFQILRGIRQGCPFSALAFIVGLEYLALRIKADIRIKGVKIDNNQNENNIIEKIIKIVMYADDVTLLLRDKDDVRLALDTIDRFYQLSGLTVNRIKTEAMWLGSNRILINSGFGIKWVNEIKILGIYFSNIMQASLIDKNWMCKVEKIKRIRKIWEKRNLGLMGKITVIKSFISSQFIYVMKTLVLPDNVLTELNTLVFRFLWRKKDCNKKAYEKVKRKVMINDYDLGGLKMIDFRILQQSFQLEKIMKLAKSSPADKWSWIPRTYFSIFGNNLSFLDSTTGLKNFKGMNELYSCNWKENLKVWLLNNKTYDIDKNVKAQCLWNNPNIQYQNNVLHYKDWAINGITNVSDISNDNNNIKTLDELCNTMTRSATLTLQYRVMFSSVTSFLRKYPIEQDESDSMCILFNNKQLSNASSFSDYLKSEMYSTPCSIVFWKNKYDIDLGKDYWLIAQKYTREARLKELHFKLLHNIYPTNLLLAKIGIATNNKCTYCLDQIDYIEHFFFHCPKIKQVWTSVSDKFYMKFDKTIILSESEAILGVSKKVGLNKDMLRFLNNLILIAKMSIGIFRYKVDININIIFDRECLIRKMS